jgi:hypothetical protein
MLRRWITGQDIRSDSCPPGLASRRLIVAFGQSAMGRCRPELVEFFP